MSFSKTISCRRDVFNYRLKQLFVALFVAFSGSIMGNNSVDSLSKTTSFDEQHQLILVEGLIVEGSDGKPIIRMQNNSNRINDAIQKAIKSNKKGILIPMGIFPISGEFPIKLSSNIEIHGFGINKSILKFYPKGKDPLNGASCIFGRSLQTIYLTNFGIQNYGSISDNRQSKTLIKSNAASVYFENSNFIEIDGIKLTGGYIGIYLKNTGIPLLENRYQTVQNNFLEYQTSAGIVLDNCVESTVSNNTILGAAIDGIKTQNHCKYLVITNNNSSSGGGNGFGFYDGLFESKIVGNTSHSNSANGFLMMGNPSLDSLSGFANNIISNNHASYNGQQGFYYNNVNELIVSDNVANSNVENGFLFQNTQNSSFANQNANNNGQHGFLFDQISRSSFTGCTASYNNSQKKSDQSVNLNFNGFHFKKDADGLILIGCIATNSKNRTENRTQNYGIFFEQGSKENILQTCIVFDQSRYPKKIGGDFESQIINE